MKESWHGFFRGSTAFFRVDGRIVPADNRPVMLATPDQIRLRLQAAISASTFDASSLARHIRRGQDYVRDFLNGRKDSIKASDLSSIEIALGLVHGSLTQPGVSEEEIASQVKSNMLFPEEGRSEAIPKRLQNFNNSNAGSDFPIYSSIDNEDGTMIVASRPMVVVARPWFMWDVRDGFGVLVSSEEAEPIFPAGTTVLVNPALPAVRRSNVIVQTVSADSGFRAMLRRYVGKTKTHWTVERLSDGKVEQIDRSEWPSTFRVVGRVDDV